MPVKEAGEVHGGLPFTSERLSGARGWERQSHCPSLYTHCWAHQSPRVSSKSMVPKSPLTHLNESPNKMNWHTHEREICGKSVHETLWYAWHMCVELSKDKFNEDACLSPWMNNKREKKWMSPPCKYPTTFLSVSSLCYLARTLTLSDMILGVLIAYITLK